MRLHHRLRAPAAAFAMLGAFAAPAGAEDACASFRGQLSTLETMRSRGDYSRYTRALEKFHAPWEAAMEANGRTITSAEMEAITAAKQAANAAIESRKAADKLALDYGDFMEDTRAAVNAGRLDKTWETPMTLVGARVLEAMEAALAAEYEAAGALMRVAYAIACR